MRTNKPTDGRSHLCGLIGLFAALAPLLALPSPAQATPPTTGIVDLYYDYVSSSWTRTLKYYWPGGGTATDSGCDDPTTMYVPERHIYRYVYGSESTTTV